MAKSSMVLVNGSVADGALADPVATATLPTTGYLAVPAGAKSVILYLGGHHDTTPVDNDYAYQVVVWRKVSDASGDASAALMYTPHLVAKGVATLGSLAMEDTSGSDYLYADTITNTLTARPDVLVFSPADNTLAWIYIELDDAVGIEMECDLSEGSGTAVTSVYALARFSEETHPFFLNRLIGGVDATTTDSLHGKIGTDTEMGDVSLYDMLRFGQWRYLPKTYSPRSAATTALFTVSYLCEVEILAVVGATLVNGEGATTVELGRTGDTDAFIAATDTDDLTTGLLWYDDTPDDYLALSSAAWLGPYTIMPVAGETVSIVGKATGDAVTTGSISVIARWRPLSYATTASLTVA